MSLADLNPAVASIGAACLVTIALLMAIGDKHNRRKVQPVTAKRDREEQL